MADTKISALTDGGAVQNTDQIPVSRSGVNFRVQVGTAAAAATGDFATAAQGVKADSAVQPTIVDAKGDLLVGSAADTLARLAAGTNTYVLTADSAEATGLKWAAPIGGGLPTGVTSPGDGALDFATGAITSSRPSVNVTQTWNNGATTFTGLQFNVTDTASDAASLLADWKVGGSSRVAIRKNGNVFLANGGGIGANEAGATSIGFPSGNEVQFRSNANYLTQNGAYYGWRGANTRLFSDADNQLDQRNGTNAQTFRVYRNYSGASDYGYTALKQDATAGFILDSVYAGSVGAPTNAIDIRANGSTVFRVTAGGQVWANSATMIIGSTLFFDARGYITWPSAGLMLLQDNGGNSISRMVFGSANSSHPAIKRSAATLQTRLADDSAFADIESRNSIQNPVASLTLATNGQLGIEMTSNTAGNLVYRGSDGTTRRAALVFA